jgi:nitric oxide reductase NorE protein
MTECLAATRHEAGHWPGEPALWSLICADMALFGFMFVVYAHDRAQNLTLFEAARPAMNQALGLAATLLLLASSWFIASAVQAARLDRPRIARFCVLPGLLCAVAFCVLKYFDYAEKFQAGITPNTNLFFTYYFALTGIHLVHVLAAIGVMSWAGLPWPAGDPNGGFRVARIRRELLAPRRYSLDHAVCPAVSDRMTW